MTTFTSRDFSAATPPIHGAAGGVEAAGGVQGVGLSLVALLFLTDHFFEDAAVLAQVLTLHEQ